MPLLHADYTSETAFCHRGGHAATADDRQRSSKPNSAARWRGVAVVCRRRTADTGSVLVQERPCTALCRTQPKARPRRLRHASD